MEEILCVALGENVKENRSILLWALQNSGGKKICIIHVHQPAQMIPFSKLPSYKYVRHICRKTLSSQTNFAKYLHSTMLEFFKLHLVD